MGATGRTAVFITYRQSRILRHLIVGLPDTEEMNDLKQEINKAYEQMRRQPQDYFWEENDDSKNG